MTSLANYTIRRRAFTFLPHMRALSNQVATSSPTHVKHEMSARGTDDFYRYTSGRWLWKEDVRLQERFKRFNVAELQRVATEATGARSCSQMIKLAEGGFNKVFKLTMNDNSEVIARIPIPNVGRVDRVIASEVATMEFVSACTPVSFITALTQNRQE